MPATYTEAERNLQEVIGKLRILHGQGVDVTEAYKTIDALRDKDDEKQRVIKTLQGTAETALLGEPATLFVLAYRKEGLTRTAYGMVKKNGHVTIELGHGWPISTSAETMLELQERLARAGIAYHIAHAREAEKAPGTTEPSKKATSSSRSLLDYLEAPRFA